MSVDGGSETQMGDAPAAAARVLGTLATQLNDALGRLRPALEAHATLLPDGTLAGLDALLAEFARRRIRIALYGEVKAGKSTLLNAVAGAPLSPVAFEPLTSIPVRVTYGDRTAWHVGDRRLDSVAQLERLMREHATDASVGGAHEVVAETDLDLLELGGQVDLLDTPGVGSVGQFDAVSAEALRSLDAVILVVRYPALFTQFTRHLMDGLQADIGKLFVVWNLDADCAELRPAERARHAETLRANVAGAHDLFLVDARAAFRAMQTDDGAGSVASGLTTLIAALRRFASSSGREVAALREAAKRARRALTAAHGRLAERHASLDHVLKETHTLLLAVQARAEAESTAARSRFADFENALTGICEAAAATAAQLAGEFRRQLRRARRQWIRRGDYPALAAATATATAAYADAVASANHGTAQRVYAEAATFGIAVAHPLRARSEAEVGQLAPEERIEHATSGRAQLLRRALWRHWYVPGLTTLERTGITEELHAQAAWVNGVVQAARDAGSSTLASRLAEITQRADAELQQIKLETNFAANEAEFDQLSHTLPLVAAQVERTAHIAAEARALL